MYNLLFKRFFSFKGRSGRKEYIVKILLTFTICIVWNYTIDKCNNNDLFTVLYVVGMAFFMNIMILQYYPLSARRLHDLNESGWYSLLTFVPISQFFILYLMFKKGTPGANKYGKPPVN